MPTEQFGMSQIKEISFTKNEVLRILLENIQARMSTSYDFDYSNPFILCSVPFEIKFRFIQSDFTNKEKMRDATMRPIEGKK